MVFADTAAAVLVEIGERAVETAFGCSAITHEVGEIAMIFVGPVDGRFLGE